MMKASLCILLVFSCQFLQSLALECEVIPGTLKQIDASLGIVGGVNNDNEVFLFLGNSFVKINGTFKHFTVGPAGEFGVSPANLLFKFDRGAFRQIQGVFKQVDAGSEIVGAVSPVDDAFCLNKDVNSLGPSGNFLWNTLSGKLKYYSCGPYSCWGVNAAENVFIRRNVADLSCTGTGVNEIISGSLSMVEVATDGSVYGVDYQGNLLQRLGVSAAVPAGTSWQGLTICPVAHKHVTFDLGRLWVICSDGSIRRCF
ncbi:hypothetical protein DNTS_018001 [Danionella cerebrum]|uniref:Fish-egg lectin-like n=1 Tax=Danionella cerebrum TaxID=2873325 RepID=A0A553NK46_9TELE|nr:hypothetical protein DNTS_018001 [Danionella translucida]